MAMKKLEMIAKMNETTKEGRPTVTCPSSETRSLDTEETTLSNEADSCANTSLKSSKGRKLMISCREALSVCSSGCMYS